MMSKSYRMLVVSLTLFALACGGDDGPQTNSDPDAADTDTTDVSDMSGGVDTGTDMTQPPDTTVPDMGADAWEDMADMVDMPPEGDPTVTSGTRLRRRYLQGGTGAQMSVDFWDDELKSPCSYERAADGELRCLPNDARRVHYSDSGCTQPVVEEVGCDQEWVKDGGEEARYYRKTSSPAVLQGQLYYESRSGNCNTASIDGDADYWKAELVPSADFVKGTIDDRTRTDGMVARYVDGEDGSRILMETVHQTLGYACDFDDNGRCLEGDASPYYQVFRYSDCTSPLFGFPEGSKPATVTVYEFDSQRCISGTTHYEVGNKTTLPGTVYRLDQNGNCQLDNPSGLELEFYEPGSEIAQFPTASTRLEGEDDLKIRRYVDDNDEPLGQADAFWDATRDEACDPMEIYDDVGKFVCVAEDRGTVSEHEFLDSSCSDSLSVGTVQCRTSAPRLLAQTEFEACTVESIRALGAAFETGSQTGPDYYHDHFGSCTMATFRDKETAFETGTEVTDSLPTLELKTE